MNHLILAETQFFAMINGKDNGSTETAYGGFVQEVINLCYGGNDAKHIIVALAFAEIELQHHPQNLSVSEENVVTVYIRKALSFIRKMQKIVSASAITSVPPLTSTSETKAVSIRPTTGIKPLYTTIATVTMNLIVSAAIVLLNPYVTVYISYKIPPFALSVHIPDVSTSIYVEVDSKVHLGLPSCDKAFVR